MQVLIPIEFASVNQAADLPFGRYSARCLVFACSDETAQALLFEYVHADSGVMQGCDLMITDADGAVRAADFVRLPDLAWRDNFGATGTTLEELLPAEMSSWVLIEERVLDTVQIEGEQ